LLPGHIFARIHLVSALNRLKSKSRSFPIPEHNNRLVPEKFI
jgi:hypothetical protein